MALANFHDRTATAASQVMQTFDLQVFDRVLKAKLIGVAFDAAAVKSPEGKVTLELAVNLLARLYPSIAIVSLDVASSAFVSSLSDLARQINPEIDIKAGKRPSACLVVGRTAVESNWNPIYLGSKGWIARLSMQMPVGSGASSNPLGAAAAACFGAANVFRKIFAKQLVRGEQDSEITLSLLDQNPAAARPENPALDKVALGELHLVGLGAIGNAATWALARIPHLTGTIHLVDHEPIELSNLQRYVLTTQEDVGKVKVELAATRLRRTGLVVNPYAKSWSEYLCARDDWRLEAVAVALDTAKDRIAVQASLPRYILNSWTQTGDLGISRHGFEGGNACLACLYLADTRAKNEDQVIADALGLPADFREVRQRLQQGIATDRAFLERVATALGAPLDELSKFEGQPLRTFYTHAVCGGALFQMTDGKKSGPALVPMAFQSTLAGILLAAEIIAHAVGLPRPKATKTTIDLLRSLSPTLLQPRTKNRIGNCICQDDDYIAEWREKYPGSTSLKRSGASA
jgi:molybdopterin/thiamine biosynthesis adenylyltransferase